MASVVQTDTLTDSAGTGSPSFPNGVPFPAGMVVSYAGATAPTGWLLCFGQVVSQATYAALFAAISTAYNTGGEGAGNFRLPDCRGRVVAGKDDMGGTAATRLSTAGSGVDGLTLGANGGVQNVALTTAQLASHNHGGATGSHTHSNSLTDPGHNHGQNAHDHPYADPSQPLLTTNNVGPGGYTAGANFQTNPTGFSNFDNRVEFVTATNIPSATGATVNNAAATASIPSDGSGTAHNNTQPTIIMNRIIKT